MEYYRTATPERPSLTGGPPPQRPKRCWAALLQIARIDGIARTLQKLDMNLNEALQEFKAIVGSEHVSAEPTDLRAAETATFETGARVLAVVRPDDTASVAECVRAANRHSVPIHPVSRGRNYGYGSRCPTSAQSVLLDLRRMNRVLGYDERMGVLTVEPGVTFEQAHEYLRGHSARFAFAGTGAPNDASLIGNVLERGLGKGLGGSRMDHFCDLEVVLPSGEVLHTGLSRYENARGKHLSRGCAGPLLDQVFTQSNLGIVTQMSLWLTPIPDYFESFVYVLKEPSQLMPVVDALQELRLKDIVRSTGTIFNDYRFLGFVGGYPWHEHDGSGALPRSIARSALRKRIPFDALWTGDGALFCHSGAQARAERDLVRRALRRHVSRLVFFNRPRVFFMDLLLRFMSLFSHRGGPSPLDTYYRASPYLGHLLPTRSALGSTYFRKRELPNGEDLDPDRDRCGVYWLGPIVPFCGEDVARVVALTEETVSGHGYEPAMTVQMANGRTVDIVCSITYDRAIPGEDKKARLCHDALFQRLAASGYYPYRLGIQSQGLLPTPDDAFSFALSRIKAALDPKGILSPGHYDGSEPRPSRDW